MALASATGSAFALTAQSGEQGYRLVESRQVFALKPGSPLHAEWAAWIKLHDGDEKKPDGTTWGHGEVGEIVLTATTPPSTVDAASINDTDATPDVGPPRPFPAKGQSGQRITIVNHTSAFYQRWTYRWQEKSDGGTGWSRVATSGRSCETEHEPGKLCENPDK
ncbi:MAG: hypothetical protein GAK28_01108 [Luteibacter sp.]|uniref:hypothetical protein n=1 Tax=Luteibacter sp. TaxID=1886636 RepID=UPI00137F21F5|nr:hypothetical protein [Luteibacter sp.]KAF1008681.1 MAG: hypothetical protein GAK28_01108 [Luteibacter sp.]